MHVPRGKSWEAIVINVWIERMRGEQKDQTSNFCTDQVKLSE